MSDWPWPMTMHHFGNVEYEYNHTWVWVCWEKKEKINLSFTCTYLFSNFISFPPFSSLSLNSLTTERSVQRDILRVDCHFIFTKAILKQSMITNHNCLYYFIKSIIKALIIVSIILPNLLWSSHNFFYHFNKSISKQFTFYQIYFLLNSPFLAC